MTRHAGREEQRAADSFHPAKSLGNDGVQPLAEQSPSLPPSPRHTRGACTVYGRPSRLASREDMIATPVDDVQRADKRLHHRRTARCGAGRAASQRRRLHWPGRVLSCRRALIRPDRLFNRSCRSPTCPVTLYSSAVPDDHGEAAGGKHGWCDREQQPDRVDVVRRHGCLRSSRSPVLPTADHLDASRVHEQFVEHLLSQAGQTLDKIALPTTETNFIQEATCLSASRSGGFRFRCGR